MEAALVKVLVGICISLGFVCSLFSSLTAEFLGGSPCLTNATRSIGQFQMGLGEKEACKGSSSVNSQQDETFLRVNEQIMCEIFVVLSPNHDDANSFVFF